MKDYAKNFAELLNEYRENGIHFLHLNTATRSLFFILDDSYYLTYRDDKKEIALSIMIKPRDDKHKPIYLYRTNDRNFDDWYADACRDFAEMPDKEFYHAPHYRDIHINYLNEDEKVPLRDFLGFIPKTKYKIINNYIIFDEIGTGFNKVEKNYKTAQDDTMGSQIKYWLHFNDEEIKAFNYVIAEPMKKFSAINFDAIDEIIPAHTNVRFVFDNGSVEVLKKILNEANNN